MEPLVQLAKLANRQAQPLEALRWLERARELRPDDDRLNRDIARAYAEDGRAAAARRFVRQLCEARPETPEGNLTAAAIEELLGAATRAVAILRRTLREHHQSFPTAVNLARLLEREGQPAEALEAVESVQALLPDSYGPALTRIDLLLELNQTARAADAIDALMLEHGGRGDLQRRLARLEVARGQTGLARDRWARTARFDRHLTGAPVNLHRLDRRPIGPADGEIRLFTRLRSQAHRLPAFLDFYRAQGVDRFFVVDNASDDGTRDLLLAQPDVHLYLTTDSYAAFGGGMRWLNELLAVHGPGAWTLTVDVDELLAYPHAEQLGLKALTRHLDAEGAEALFAFMLDLYPEGPVAGAHCAPDQSPLTVCPLFDRAGYVRHPSPTFPFTIVQGGPMSRILRETRLNGTYLHKVPLIRWRPDIRHTASTHHPFPVRLALATGVLLHFKYLSDLPDKAAVESERKQYSQGGKRYTALTGLFGRDADLTLVSDLSLRLQSTRQLVELGHMRSTAALDALALSHPGQRLRGWAALEE